MAEKTKQVPIFPLMSVNFIGTLSFSIMLPFLVYLVEKFKGNEFLYGALGASFSLCQLIGAPILGRLSDYYGRKKILFICEAGSFVSWVVFFVALYLPVNTLFHFNSGLLGNITFTLPLLVLFIARMVDGITAGDISVANAYLADITDDANLKKNFGKMAASANIGFILGPLLAGALGATALGLKLPIMAAGAISLAALFLIAFGLPESMAKAHKFRSGHNEAVPGIAEEKQIHPKFSFLLAQPNVGMMLVLYFLIYLGFNFFYTAFPLYASEILKWNVVRMSVFFAVLSGMMVLVQGPLLTALSKKFSDVALTIIGGLILASNFVVMMSHNEVVLYGAAALFSLGNGLMWPSFLSILSRVAGHTYQGAIQGLASSAGSLASIIGLIGGGILFHTYHEKTFLIAAGIILLVFVFSFRLLKLKSQTSEEVPQTQILS
jgi:DHA1 family tetracycline resistance protein-like MFS transporter